MGSKRARRYRPHSAADKVALLRKVLLEGQAVSAVCEEHDVSPALFYFRISFCVHVPMIAEHSCRVEWLESGRQLLPVRTSKHWICKPPGLIASVRSHEAGCRISLSRPGQRTRRIRTRHRYATRLIKMDLTDPSSGALAAGFRGHEGFEAADKFRPDKQSRLALSFARTSSDSVGGPPRFGRRTPGRRGLVRKGSRRLVVVSRRQKVWRGPRGEGPSRSGL
jgi:hypothetical protein